MRYHLLPSSPLPMAQDMLWESSESPLFPVASSGTSLYEVPVWVITILDMCCPASLKHQQECLGHVIRTFRRNHSNYCSWIPQENCPNAHTAEDTWPSPADWKHISDGKDPSRIHPSPYRDFIGSSYRGLHIRVLRGSYTSRALLLQPSLPPFTALCHWDVREQSFFHKKQAGNWDFDEISTLFAPKPINVSGWFSPFMDNKVICS